MWNHADYWYNKTYSREKSQSMKFNLLDKTAWLRLLEVKRKKLPNSDASDQDCLNQAVPCIVDENDICVEDDSEDSISIQTEDLNLDAESVVAVDEEPKLEVRKDDGMKVKFKMPCSWAETVQLRMCKYLSETFGGKNNVKRSRFYKTDVEMYAKFVHPEGIVTILKKYKDVRFKVMT